MPRDDDLSGETAISGHTDTPNPLDRAPRALNPVSPIDGLRIQGPDEDGLLWIGVEGEPVTWRIEPIAEPDAGTLVLYLDCAAPALKEARHPQTEAFGIPIGRVIAVSTDQVAGLSVTEAQWAEYHRRKGRT